MMSDFSLKVVYVDYKDEMVSFSLLSLKQDDISAFVKALAKKGYQVYMDKVDLNNFNYLSIVRVSVK